MAKKKKEREVEKIITDSGNLCREIWHYINDTPHFIYYWIKDEAIGEYYEEYGDEFEGNISLSVEYINGGIVTVRLDFLEEHPKGYISLIRHCYLSLFRQDVECNFTAFHDNLLTQQIKDAEKKLKEYKDAVANTEQKLKELKKKQDGRSIR